MEVAQVPFSSLWKSVFEEEAEHIRQAIGTPLANEPPAIHHVGSTSVLGLSAKPFIDIAVAGDVPLLHTALTSIGYTQKSYTWFVKEPRPPHNLGFSVHCSGVKARAMVSFRDALINSPEKRAQYSKLKADLVAEGLDFIGYTLRKTDFILETTGTRDGGSIFVEALRQKNDELAKELIRDPTFALGFNCDLSYELSRLVFAIYYRRWEVVKHLLQKGDPLMVGGNPTRNSLAYDSGILRTDSVTFGRYLRLFDESLAPWGSPIIFFCRSPEDIDNILACGIPADLRAVHKEEISLRDYHLFAAIHPCDFGDTLKNFEDPTLQEYLHKKRKEELKRKPKKELGREPLRFEKTRNILVLGEKGSKKTTLIKSIFALKGDKYTSSILARNTYTVNCAPKLNANFYEAIGFPVSDESKDLTKEEVKARVEADKELAKMYVTGTVPLGTRDTSPFSPNPVPKSTPPIDLVLFTVKYMEKWYRQSPPFQRFSRTKSMLQTIRETKVPFIVVVTGSDGMEPNFGYARNIAISEMGLKDDEECFFYAPHQTEIENWPESRFSTHYILLHAQRLLNARKSPTSFHVWESASLWKSAIESGTTLEEVQLQVKNFQRRLNGAGTSAGEPSTAPSSRLDRNLLRTDLMTKENIIGAAQYGTVYLTLYEDTIVAVKVLRDILQGVEKHTKEFREEIDLACRLKHPNVVNTVGYVEDETTLMMCMERECASLKSILLKLPTLGKKLTVIQIAKLATDLCLGMNYLHLSGRVHRDMHPGNFLVASDWTAKITDFGASGHIATMMSKLTSTKGAPLYQAPETEAMIYRFSSDNWSFGILFSEICSGHHFDDPKPANSLSEMTKRVKDITETMDEEQKSFATQLKEAIGTSRLALALLRRETALKEIETLNDASDGVFSEIGRKCMMLESIELGSRCRGSFSDYVCALEKLKENRKWDYTQAFPVPLYDFLKIDPPKNPLGAKKAPKVIIPPKPAPVSKKEHEDEESDDDWKPSQRSDNSDCLVQ